MEFLENMWKNHRTATIVIGVLLLPITLAILGIKIYMALNLAGAKKSIENAQKKDDQLSAQEDALKKQADAAQREADKAAQRVEDRHNDGGVDMDWNKKRND